jgi:hypothetical protein
MKFLKKLFKRFTKVSMGVLSLAVILGFLSMGAQAFAASEVTTVAATGISSSDATLNGTNGLTAADGHSFWVSLSTFSTASSTIPAGVYSTPDMGSIAGNTTFSASLSSITTTGVPSNLPAITPNTTYYFAAWTDLGGTWYPGDVLSFTTLPIVLPSVVTNPATSVGSTSATLNGTNGPVNADNTSFWWGTGPAGSLTAMVDPTSEFPSGWTHDSGLGALLAGLSFSEALTGLTPNTTYNFVAWSQVGGTWYPGEVLSFTTLPVVLPSVVTNPALPIGSTAATVNGTNGPVNADNTSFWWGTTSIGSLTAAADASSQFPSSGWSHDPGLGAASAGASFNEALTGLTPSSTYYFVAWSHVGGIWYPGAVLNFKTNGDEVCTPDDPVQTIVSDTSTQYNSSNSTVLIPNGGWVSIPGASWIWGSNGSADNTTVPTTEAFMRNFSITGTPTSASINLSADNGYVLKVNGTTVDSQNVDPANELNYQSVHTYDILGYVHSGANTLEVDVTNFGRANTTFNMNPAGLLYSLTLTSDECVTPPTTTPGTISGMKYNDLNRNGKWDTGEPGLPGWVIRLLSEDPITHKLTLVDTQTTDASGNYSFTNVAPGIYDVRETHQMGWKRMSMNPQDIVITDSSTVIGVDFGNAKIKRGEKEDNSNDDNRNDRWGFYFANHGWSNYMFDFNKGDHTNFNGHFGFGGNSGFKGNLLNFFKR